MNGLSERLWYLELQNKALKKQLASFKSGNAYIKLRDEYESILREKDRKICRLENDLSKEHAQIIDNRNHWFSVYEDMEKEAGQATKSKDKEIERLEKRAIRVEKQRDDAIESAGEWRRKYYELSGEARRDMRATVLPRGKPQKNIISPTRRSLYMTPIIMRQAKP